jgi:hypothetical protein
MAARVKPGHDESSPIRLSTTYALAFGDDFFYDRRINKVLGALSNE